MHGIYKLLYKVVHVFGNSSMASKLKCHNIQDGPRPIQQNLELFKELVVFTQIQIQIIGSNCKRKIKSRYSGYNQSNILLIDKFLNNMIWFDNRTGNVLCNG